MASWKNRFSRVEVVGSINVLSSYHLDVLLKSVFLFSASDSENETDREGEHLAARRLSQQVINVFMRRLCSLGDIVRLPHQWRSFKLR